MKQVEKSMDISLAGSISCTSNKRARLQQRRRCNINECLTCSHDIQMIIVNIIVIVTIIVTILIVIIIIIMINICDKLHKKALIL